MVPAQAMHELIFSYQGTEKLLLPARSRREWSPAPGEAAVLYAAGIPLKAALQGGPSRLADDIAAGEFMLVPAGCSCTLGNDGGRAGEALLVRFIIRGPEGTLEAIRSFQREYLAMERIRSFRMPQAGIWMSDFTRGCTPGDFAQHYRLQSHLYLILSGFMDAVRQPKAAGSDLQAYVRHVREHIVKHCHEVMDIEELAQASGVSSGRFYRAFRRQVGLSPLQFATEARLQASMRLLAEYGASVAEAAHAAGYADEHYFSRVFKKQLGLPPSLYRQAARRRIAVLSPVFSGDLAPLGLAPCLTLDVEGTAPAEEALEQLRRTAPDRILSGPVPDAVLCELEAVAPTLILRPEDPWRRRLAEAAAWLELAPVAEHWTGLFEAMAENARKRLRERWGSEPAVLAEACPHGMAVYGRRSHKLSVLFYEELGVAPPLRPRPMEVCPAGSLAEWAGQSGCHLIVLVPPEAGQGRLAALEQEWRVLAPHGRWHCLFLPCESEPESNAGCLGQALEQLLRQME
ncbi:helix-turn-helix transcriptional regulator [Paenibacillus glufosinatiresistens]|uniref:helix-turn-helix transcriptional regulator n=1 Tax=Paenibacillus glufosinatiresistens TaxID=3070657 RepID=UPI00286D9FB6|nr:AraC family transcriptional regulator [Paenibacillus sp. YX.27]